MILSQALGHTKLHTVRQAWSWRGPGSSDARPGPPPYATGSLGDACPDANSPEPFPASPEGRRSWTVQKHLDNA